MQIHLTEHFMPAPVRETARRNDETQKRKRNALGSTFHSESQRFVWAYF
jgi:hypothetical protein